MVGKTLYSTSDVANLFGISRVTVYRWVKEGKIRAFSLGKNLKIPSFEIKRLLHDFGISGISSHDLDGFLKDHEVQEIIEAMAKEGRRDSLLKLS